MAVQISGTVTTSTRNGSPVFLVDTNILVYAYDAASVDKRTRAIAVIGRLLNAQIGALSVQILGEFYSTLTKPTSRFPLTSAQAEAAVQRFCRTWTVFELTSVILLEAVRGARQH